ncbi:isochorismatase family protein [Paenarthrobacter sp. NPDC089322]|uniref:isochorismatase family protein n=1 Tax=Paenarthrobacter sp. NPDC089322 TaxID=3155065 RepID=UPI0034291780
MLGFLNDDVPPGHTYRRVHAVPGPWQARENRVPEPSTFPEVWVLGSSPYSAQLAVRLGRPYAFALQFGDADIDTAMRLYRENFQPSAVLAEPHTLVSVPAAIGDDPFEAKRQAATSAMAMLRMFKNEGCLLLPPDEVEAYQTTLQRRQILDAYTSRSFHGTAATVADRLEALHQRTGVDEVMLVVGGHSPTLDQHGITLIADHYQLPYLNAPLPAIAPFQHSDVHNTPLEGEPHDRPPHRALIVIDAQQEYFDGLLPIQYPDRDQSITSIQTAIKAAEQTGTPVVVVQHELPAEAPVFAAGSATWQNHPQVAVHENAAARLINKQYSTIFADTDLEAWLREQGIDTITLAGYMTNNCVVASAAAAEPLGFTVEVLSDATGAIDLANDAGTASARQVHETLMALMHSNWAAVTDTATWTAALRTGTTPTKSDLITSAAQGRNTR